MVGTSRLLFVEDAGIKPAFDVLSAGLCQGKHTAVLLLQEAVVGKMSAPLAHVALVVVDVESHHFRGEENVVLDEELKNEDINRRDPVYSLHYETKTRIQVKHPSFEIGNYLKHSLKSLYLG